MGRRALTWIVVLPIAGLGILLGHGTAYVLTGADPGPLHGYLAHAPQVLALLALVALVGLAVQGRATRVSSLPFAFLSLFGFAVQEHVERLAHSGDVPVLVTDRTFLLGLVLQLPFALVCLAIAHALVGALRSWDPTCGARLPALLLDLVRPLEIRPRATAWWSPAHGRAPPS